MKEFLEDVIEQAGDNAKEEVAEAKLVLESDLFIEQKGIRSLIDKDARVGYKSKTSSFFGYKMEYAMTNEGIITGVGVHNGAYVDSLGFEWLYTLSKEAITKINAVFADKAYFKKSILDLVKDDKALPYIPVNASTYKVDEENFRYNKDSDQWFCNFGNQTISKKHKKYNSKKQKFKEYYEYVFAKEICKECPNKTNCISKAETRKLHIGINTNEYYDHSQWAKTEEFLEGYKQRAKIEGKNGEMKRFHGLARASGYGLKSVTNQAKFTALAVNLKRIVKLISSLNLSFINILCEFSKFSILEKIFELKNSKIQIFT
jgi:hypothetical protein